MEIVTEPAMKIMLETEINCSGKPSNSPLLVVEGFAFETDQVLLSYWPAIDV